MKSPNKMDVVNRGQIPSSNLTEILKVDFALLASSAFPDLPRNTVKKIGELSSLGILKRMASTAELLIEWNVSKVSDIAATHPSDTVRGWAAFIEANQATSLKAKISAVKPFADDPHFGVREWAWLAVRDAIAKDIEQAVAILVPWTKSKSHYVRRFASEATRPRGVWAAHIGELKKQPEIGLPILEPLKTDPERYVQDSVGNWLNDASKSQPLWVKKLCSHWAKVDNKDCNYIIQRALRTIQKK